MLPLWFYCDARAGRIGRRKKRRLTPRSFRKAAATVPRAPHFVCADKICPLDRATGMAVGFDHRDFGWLVALDPHAFALPASRVARSPVRRQRDPARFVSMHKPSPIPEC